MPPNIFNSSLRLGTLALLTVTAGRAHSQAYDPDWTRTFRAGVLVGFNLKASFSMKGSFGISGGGAGVYDDGYVRPDAGGALTSDWGYKNGTQYDPASETLTMHRSTAFSTTGSATVKDSADIGLDLAYGGTFTRGERFRLGWELGFGLLPIKISDRSTLSATVSQKAYKFDASGYVIGADNIFPLPGWHGSPNSPGGATIGSGSTETRLPDISNVQVIGSRTLDVNFYAIKLGPTLFYDLSPSIGLSLGIGPALGIVSGNLKYDETLTYVGGSSHNIGSIGSTKLTFGGYINGMVTFHTVQNGDFYIGAQYMPMGKVTLGGGGRQSQLNLNGAVYVTAGINWPF